jgi:hypothetical protein
MLTEHGFDLRRVMLFPLLINIYLKKKKKKELMALLHQSSEIRCTIGLKNIYTFMTHLTIKK